MMMHLSTGRNSQLTAHVDSNWGAGPGFRTKSRTGSLHPLWARINIHNEHPPENIALSSTKAKYVLLSEACRVPIG